MSRRTASGLNSVLVIVFILGIITIVYYLAERHPLRADLTQNKVQTLSPLTMKVIRNMSRRLEIVAFFKSGSPEETMVTDLLKEYRRRSRFIDYKSIDPEQRPSEMRRLGMNGYGVAFISGRQQKNVPASDIFKQSQDAYNQQPPQFHGEQVITDAVIAVTSKGQKNVCLLEGHGEKDFESTKDDGYSNVAGIITGANMNIRSLSFAISKRVPSDCSVLGVFGPQKNLSATEIEAIDEYLKNGGRALVLIEPLHDAGLGALLSKWGLNADNDYVVDTGSFLPGDPLTPIPILNYHEITTDISDAKMSIIMPTARSISELKEKPDSLNVSILMQSSDKSWGETNFRGRTLKFDVRADQKGPLPLAAAVSGAVSSDNDADKPQGTGSGMRMVVVGDSDFASNAMIQISGNSDFFVNSVNWLAGQEKFISIRPRPAVYRQLVITGPQRNLLFLVCAVVVPLAVFFTGVVIWFRRRSR